MTSYYPGYTTQNIDLQRDSTSQQSIIQLNKDHVPISFPMELWTGQQQRYLDYWHWFTGYYLSEVRGYTKEKKPIMKYPLGINPIRNFARKHAAVLLGEEAYDSPQPLVKTIVRPKNPIRVTELEKIKRGEVSGEFTDEERKLALTCANIVNEVWMESRGRALQMEAAELTQFLGGCAFQVCWQPEKADEKLIPVTIRHIVPDYFMPIWENDDYYNLLEAFVVYRIPAAVAAEKYGWGGTSHLLGWVTYCEHWTRNHYSILLNGEPVTATYKGVSITYDKLDNPFGFVPFVYIPHVREGSFWGNSMVDDVRGLVKELNSRSADVGDAIRGSVHRKRYGRDITRDPKEQKLGSDTWVLNVGNSNPATKAKPDIWTEDPPELSPGMTDVPKELWLQLLREGQIGDVAFGEDEGSQRSALTLAFRMWPSTAHARVERTFWTEGLNEIAKMILKMVYEKQDEIDDIELPDGFLKEITIAQDWLPMIPRDREQMVDEIIIRFQAGLLSPQRALRMFGDVEYVDEEIDRIKEWLEFKAELSMTGDEDGNQAGEGAETETDTPVAGATEE